MTDFYCDKDASGSNNGTSPANAWSDIETAIEYAFTAGDKLWVRRTFNTVQDSDLAPTADGSPKAPIYCIGWPRNAASITSATWTNGDATVADVVGITVTREAHQARWITAPDGKKYVITKVNSTSSFEIDRLYPSSSVSGASGAASIDKDLDYDTRPQAGIDALWDGDADTLPVIDFDNGDFQVNASGANWRYWINFRFEDSSDASGIINFPSNMVWKFKNVLIRQSSANTECLNVGSGTLLFMDVFTIEGSGSGNAQSGLYGITQGLILKNGAIYNMGLNAIQGCYGGYLENINLGIEAANGSTDLPLSAQVFVSRIIGRDVALNSVLIQDFRYLETIYPCLAIENYGKVVGVHKIWSSLFSLTKTDVVAGSGDPQKRTGGADAVIGLGFNTSSTYRSVLEQEMCSIPFLIHEFEVDDTSKTYRYYVQSEAALGPTELWLEAEYIDVYDDADEYHMGKVLSDESVSARSGADDWSQYIEVTVDPAVAGKVRIKGFARYYHATNEVYVDPKVVIS